MLIHFTESDLYVLLSVYCPTGVFACICTCCTCTKIILACTCTVTWLHSGMPFYLWLLCSTVCQNETIKLRSSHALLTKGI